MDGANRREKIIQILDKSAGACPGAYIAKILNVSRQVIVQDIAILRAKGNGIIATPQGYIIPKFYPKPLIKRVIACTHDKNGLEDELKTIISLGGRVIDVMVEHPVYGEIKGMLMLSSIYDVDVFIKKLEKSAGQPLLVLTGGTHLHTIEADSDDKLDMIEDELKKKGYLLNTKS